MSALMRPIRRVWEIVRLFLIAGGLAYLGLWLCAWRLGPEMAFPRPPLSYGETEDLVWLSLPDGRRVAATYLPHPGTRQVVLYSHGNYEDLGDIRPFLELIHRQGFSVFAYDYPGYGLSEGEPTEASCLAATLAAYRHLREVRGYEAQQIIAHGRSLGGGPALWLATQEPLGGLVLESTFTSAYRVVTRVRLLPADIFDNIGRASQVRCPVLVLHGEDDLTVPLWHGQKLFAALPEPKVGLWLPGGHNDLLATSEALYWEGYLRFLNSLLPSDDA